MSRIEEYLINCCERCGCEGLPAPLSTTDKLLYHLAETLENGGGGGGSASIDVTASVGQTIVVEEVDANGKPTKWKAAEYQERTHWMREGLADIVPEIPFTPVLDESMSVYMHPLPRFELEDGKSYTVIFDGVEYACTAFSGDLNNMPFVAIGNGAVAGGANTGEPFAVAVLTATTGSVVLFKRHYAICFDSDEHTVRIIENKIVPHKIPDEYVTSSSFPVNITVKNSSDPSNAIVLLTPWEDIINAVKTGKVIYLRTEGDDYGFDAYGNPHAFYCVRSMACTDARVSTNTLECTLNFMLTGNSNGTVNYLTIARDEDGVTTITASGPSD